MTVAFLIMTWPHECSEYGFCGDPLDQAYFLMHAFGHEVDTRWSVIFLEVHSMALSAMVAGGAILLVYRSVVVRVDRETTVLRRVLWWTVAHGAPRFVSGFLVGAAVGGVISRLLYFSAMSTRAYGQPESVLLEAVLAGLLGGLVPAVPRIRLTIVVLALSLVVALGLRLLDSLLGYSERDLARFLKLCAFFLVPVATAAYLVNRALSRKWESLSRPSEPGGGTSPREP